MTDQELSSMLTIFTGVQALSTFVGIFVSAAAAKFALDAVNASKTSLKWSQSQWRLAQVNSYCDELDRAISMYWTASPNRDDDIKNASDIKRLLRAIEQSCDSAGVDISKHMQDLKRVSTGGEFGSPSRTPLKLSNELFMSCSVHLNNIKDQLQKHLA